MLLSEEDRDEAELDIGDRVRVRQPDGSYDETAGIEWVEWEFPEHGVVRKRLGVNVTNAVR